MNDFNSDNEILHTHYCAWCNKQEHITKQQYDDVVAKEKREYDIEYEKYKQEKSEYDMEYEREKQKYDIEYRTYEQEKKKWEEYKAIKRKETAKKIAKGVILPFYTIVSFFENKKTDEPMVIKNPKKPIWEGITSKEPEPPVCKWENIQPYDVSNWIRYDDIGIVLLCSEECLVEYRKFKFKQHQEQQAQRRHEEWLAQCRYQEWQAHRRHAEWQRNMKYNK